MAAPHGSTTAIRESEDSEILALLNNEAHSQYRRHPRSDRFWSALLFVSLVILALSLFGTYRRLQELRAESQRLAALALTPAPALPTKIGYSVFPKVQSTRDLGMTVRLVTPPAVKLYLPFGAQNSNPGDSIGSSSQAASLSMSATATAASVCLDPSQYHVDVSVQAQLFPDPGTTYIAAPDNPQAQATWTIKNLSYCDWKQITIFSTMDREIQTPLLFQHGDPLVLDTSSGETISPQEEILIRVVINAVAAQNVDRNWVLVINGLPLYDQPHLVLNVRDWILLAAPTAVRPRVVKPVLPPKPTVNPLLQVTSIPVAPPSSRPTDPPPEARP
jgi:hypothetical protein